MKNELKRGKLSIHEMNYIKANMADFSPQEIAATLNRTETPILKYIEKINIEALEESSKSNSVHKLANVLKSRWYWREIQAQFTEHEQSMFLSQWVEYYTQFGEDVVPTEENEMIELIRTDILIDRGMKELKQAQEQISKIGERMDREMEMPVPNDAILAVLGERLANLHGVKVNHTKNHDVLLSKKATITKALKGTRDQRRQMTENSRVNFTAWLRSIEDEESKRREGFEMEKHRIAMEKAKKELAMPHKYMDNKVDQPLLNSQTVLKEEE